MSTFPRARVTSAPIFSSESQSWGWGCAALGRWLHNMLTQGRHFSSDLLLTGKLPSLSVNGKVIGAVWDPDLFFPRQQFFSVIRWQWLHCAPEPSQPCVPRCPCTPASVCAKHTRRLPVSNTITTMYQHKRTVNQLTCRSALWLSKPAMPLSIFFTSLG